MRTKIKVTKEDIECGDIGDINSCPIARAMKREVKSKFRCDVSVTEDDIGIGEDFEIKTPKRAGEFVDNFDYKRLEVKPFEFHINIPNRFLKRKRKPVAVAVEHTEEVDQVVEEKVKVRRLR
jgi:hypothetical protein